MELGPVTEARFRQTFANTALVTAKAAADLIGLDTDTLAAMTDDGTVRAVRRGRLRSYTEHDLRAFLLSSPSAPYRPRRNDAPVQRPEKVVPFSARRKSPGHK